MIYTKIKILGLSVLIKRLVLLRKVGAFLHGWSLCRCYGSCLVQALTGSSRACLNRPWLWEAGIFRARKWGSCHGGDGTPLNTQSTRSS